MPLAGGPLVYIVADLVDPRQPPARDRTGQILGPYRVGAMLGAGGMGRVYLAEDTADGRVVALKILNDEIVRERSARIRFLREAQSASAVLHPGVAAVFAIHEVDDAIFIAMEYVEGRTLRALLDAQRGPLELREALRIARDIADALVHAHAAGVVHRDLKPENLMLDARGRLKILDFGLAKQAGVRERDVESASTLSFATADGVILGTPSYMAPEQIHGKPTDGRADIFSIGVVLYELAAGVRPFRGASTMEVLIATARDELTPASTINPRVPPGLDALLARCLAKAPEDRLATAEELSAALDELLLAEVEVDLQPADPAATRGHRGEVLPPRVLRGREVETAALLAAVARARDGGTRLVLVRGDPGAGKSALLSSLRDPVTRAGGRFVAGKFDRNAQGAPLAPLAQALGALVRQVAAGPPAEVARWRADLSDATGANRHVLDDMIPELRRLLGEPPAAPAYAAEARNWFHAALQRLVRLFAVRSPPLVLALDDLHAADPAALHLLELFLSDPAGGHLLVLASYRPGDLGDAHPLTLTQARLRRLGAAVDELALAPLVHTEVVQLVADALAVAPADAAPLAGHLDVHARGNPSAMRHLLLGMRREGRLEFDSAAGRWRWDEAAALAGAADVGGFVAARLRRLAPGVRRVLAIAALAGRPVDLALLSAVDRRGPLATTHDLREALREGMLVPSDSALHSLQHNPDPAAPAAGRTTYQTLHDGIQQAAQALLDADERAAIHLQLGRHLLRQDAPSDDLLFAIVDHLERGAAGITDPAERERLARLHLEASRRARSATAHAAAVRHARAGLAALAAIAPDPWARYPDHTFQLQREWMHAEAMRGDLDAADALFDPLVAHAGSELERADLFRLKAQLDTYHGRPYEAIAAGLAGLYRLDVELLPRPEPAEVEADYHALARVLDDLSPGTSDTDLSPGTSDTDLSPGTSDTDLSPGTSVSAPETARERARLDALAERPACADPRVAAVSELLAAIAPAAMFADTRLAYRLFMRLTELWAVHGPTRASAYGLAGYGLYLAGARRDAARAHTFGQRALHLRGRFADPALDTRILHIVGGLITGWVQPFAVAAELLEQGYASGVQTGDFATATYNATTLVLVLVARRHSLTAVRATAEQLLTEARPMLEVYGSSILRGSIRMVRCLAGELADPAEGPVERWSADVFERELERDVSPLTLLYLHIYRSIVLYHFGRHDDPRPLPAPAADRLAALRTPMTVDYFFYAALHLCAALPAADAPGRRAEVEAHLARLREFAAGCPANFEARSRLAEAAYHRACGRDDAAESAFKLAIRAARRHGESGTEAVACELAGRHALALGDDIVGQMYLRAAVDAYQRWGAPAIARRLAAAFDLAAPG